jgi:hypothetical protein
MKEAQALCTVVPYRRGRYIVYSCYNITLCTVVPYRWRHYLSVAASLIS